MGDKWLMKKSLGIVERVVAADKISKVKPFLSDTRSLKRHVYFTRKIISDYLSYDFKKSPLTFIDFAISCYQQIESNYTIYMGPFSNDKWVYLSLSKMVEEMICDLIKKNTTKFHPVYEKDDYLGYQADINGVVFGWTQHKSNYDYRLYVKKQFENNYKKALEEIFWGRSKNMILTINTPNKNNEIEEVRILFLIDKNNKNFIQTKSSKTYADDLNDYLKIKISRSVLFYGPPGSGKTNTVKGIANILGLKTLRLHKMHLIRQDILEDIVNLFNPECLVVEDINKMPTGSVDSFLDKLQSFSDNNKCLLATANEISGMDDAILRPGRFDHLIKISTLEPDIVMNLIDNDKEIFDKVNSWPAASIIEMMKRVKAKGKKYALENIKDLSDRVEKIQKTNYNILE